MRYGFIGLGSLGGHLAFSLARNGIELAVHDANPEAVGRFRDAGIACAGTLAELAGRVDAVITCLPSPAVSEAVLDGLVEALAPGAAWIEMSTLGRNDILRLAAKAQAAGLGVLEAPVTGGVHLAARGAVTVLVGGAPELAAAHRPALEAMGGKVFHLGPLGAAATAKVITNMLAFIHLVATGEALMLAKRGGLDLGQAWAAIAASSGNSFVHETEGQLILNGSYDIAFTFDLALKDLGFALAMGREWDVPLDLAALTTQAFVRGKAAYGGSAQSTQVVKLLEDLVGVDLRAEGFPARLA